jgi:putative CocE/NonD family hydrolase
MAMLSMLIYVIGLLTVFTANSQQVPPTTAQTNNNVSKADAPYVIDTALSIPMPDGIKLSGVLVYPGRQQGPFATVLVISCYPYGNDYDRQRCKTWADSGFAALVVYARGKERSEGVFYPFENDAADNYAVIDWISHQPWCNGNVGMYGGSYLGFTQWAAVKKLHPALKTIVPQASVAPGIDFPDAGGVFDIYALQWLKYVRNVPYLDTVQWRDSEGWSRLKKNYQLNGYAFNRLDSADGHYDTVFQRWLAHPAADSFWQRMKPTQQEMARVNIPVLTTTGYFDADQRGALYYYRMHQQYGPAAEHYLLIGPYNHPGAQGGKAIDEIEGHIIDSAAKINLNSVVAQWMHHHLRGGPQPQFLQNRVSVFVMGENKWHYFSGIDKMNSDTLCWYMEDKLRLTAQQKAGKPIELSFNTRYLSGDSLLLEKGGMDVYHLTKQKQLLQFTSAVFDKDVIWNGSPVADLWLSLSVPDADIAFAWWEIDQNGKWRPLTYTRQRLSLSADRTRRNIWNKEEIYRVHPEDAAWISKLIKKGSRLKLMVYPLVGKCEMNYGGSREVSSQTRADGGPVTLRIYTDTEHPSRVLIPVM